MKARAAWIGAISLVAASCPSAPPGRTSKLYTGIAIMSVPVWVVGAALFYRSTRMKE